MFAIGCHLSVLSGYTSMGEVALSIGADTFQFFSRNPRGGKAKEIDSYDVAGLKNIIAEHDFPVILAHAPYTMNLCSAKPSIRAFGSDMMKDDFERMEMLPGNFYNFHPGNHTGQGVETGIKQITSTLNELMKSKMSTTVLLETMAGKGTEIGSIFEEIKAIIDRVKLQDKIGVCLDTCHIFDAGYDIVNDLDGVLDEFESVIGLRYLKAIHLNDSKNPCGSHKDRHEKLGEGYIGAGALKNVVTHPLLKDLPFYLETPNNLSGYSKEIAIVRSWRKEI